MPDWTLSRPARRATRDPTPSDRRRCRVPAAGRPALVAGAIVAAAVLPALLAGEAFAQSLTPMQATLNPGRYGGSAVWDGQHAYVFGGRASPGNDFNEVIRYDAVADEVTVTGATAPLTASSAVWTGTVAYTFGGRVNYEDHDEIRRFDPTTETLEVVGHLPSPRYLTSAVWTGRFAYVFGGVSGDAGYLDQIVRFDPVAGASELLNVRLPTPLYSAPAVWTGSSALILGGHDGSTMRDVILQFCPATLEIEPTGDRLPAPVFHGSAVWDGEAAYYFAGTVSTGATDRVVRYAPGSDGVFLTSRFDSPRAVAPAVWDGARAYAFGGAITNDLATGQIVRFDPPQRPSAPRNLTAVPGPGDGEISLAWEAPESDGGEPITAYAVHRTDQIRGGTTRFLVGANTTYVDLPPAFSVYEYAVAAVNLVGEGPRSNDSCAVGGRLAGESPAYVQALMASGCPAA